MIMVRRGDATTVRRGGASIAMLGGLLALGSACGDDGTTPGEDTGAATGGSTGNVETADSTGSAMLPEGCDGYVEPSDDDQTAVQEALLDIGPGQTLCLGAGTYSFTRQLTLAVDGATVRGAGMEQTILDFSGQISGANGLLVSSNDVTLEMFQVHNTPGDGIRADDVDNITFDAISVIWDEAESLDNGAYGLYPVQSNGVTVRNSLVQGSRDAGIYVGQSTMILVEDCEARGNVAGIEIENSTDAIVRNNYAHDNTAGILVFNLPGLDIGDGKRANVYNNRIENNNVPNFGEPGTIVAQVPYGIGALILAADANEFADNEVTGNDSAGLVIIAYIDDLFSPPDDPDFDIYAEGNYVYGNTFTDNGNDPHELILLVGGGGSPSPAILFGGCYDEAKDNSDGSLSNCLGDNGDASFIAADLCAQLGMPDPDAANYTCEHTPLPRDF